MSARTTDRDLRLQALKLDDPYEQPGLIWEIKADAQLLDVLNIYEYKKYPIEKAYCVSCGGHHHKKGFTCITSHGDRMMFGSKCGADAFGESWIVAERRIREQQVRQHELLRRDRMGTILAPMQKALQRWVRPVGYLAMRRIGFSTMLPELYLRCHEAAQRYNGTLMVSEKVRLKLGNEPDWVERPYAALPGKALFHAFDRFNVVHAVEDAQAAITAVEATIANTDGYSTTALKRARLSMERSFGELEEVAAAYEGAQAFFTPKTYKLLAEWSWVRNVIGERYLFERGLLKQADTGRAVSPLDPIPELDDEILDLIREYRRAD